MAWAGLVAGIASTTSGEAQTVPFSDTEDSSLGEVSVGSGRLHPIGRLNLRNGDYARGSYDDDSSNLDRLPVHLEVGLVYDVRDGPAGKPDIWIELHSSNGFHAPSSQEQTRPRSFYESNNLLGVVAEPIAGLRTALTYTIKTSPNDVAATTHEASVAITYQADRGIGWLHPNAVATMRPKGGHGLYTQIGVEPEWKLGTGERAPSVSLPVTAGIGWNGFYQPGSATVHYESVGLAYALPFRIAGARSSLRGEMAALIRDHVLARLDGDDANRNRVVPIGQLTLSVAY